jgi:hypothetical protein
VNFLYFVSSLFSLRCRLSFDRRCHATAPCHASFPLSQNKFAVSASSFDNALSRRLPSRIKTKVLNLHHHCRLSYPYRSTPILHCYKKIISILITLFIIQPCLYFTSSLARASRHRSFTRRCRSFSPLSHAYRPSV